MEDSGGTKCKAFSEKKTWWTIEFDYIFFSCGISYTEKMLFPAPQRDQFKKSDACLEHFKNTICINNKNQKAWLKNQKEKELKSD